MGVTFGECNKAINIANDTYSYGKEQTYNTKSDEARAKNQSAC
jgi:hypothetical protein